MGWYIFGITSLIVILFLWKNAYWQKTPTFKDIEYTQNGRIYTKEEMVGYEYYDKIKMPLWLFILFLIAFLIPIVNLLIILGLIIFISVGIINDDIYIHFNENTTIGKIGKFLSKDIF